MFRKSIAMCTIVLSLSVAACSSDDDDDGSGSGTNGTDSSETDSSDSDGSGADVIPAATPGVGNSAYDSIVNNPDLSTLRQAIDEAGLAATLDNEDTEFTIFAPNNAAFLTLDPGLLPTLLADPSGQLTGILTNHVVAGTTDAAAATAAAPADLTTLNDTTISLAATDAGLTIGGLNIIGPDSNFDPDTSVGVVHVIDGVLIP